MPMWGKYYRMSLVSNFIRIPAVQKFWKSVKIWQSYREFKGGNFSGTQGRLISTVHSVMCLFTPQLSMELILPTHGGMARLIWPEMPWCTCPQTVTHPSTNRARRRATALIDTNALRPPPRQIIISNARHREDTITGYQQRTQNNIRQEHSNSADLRQGESI